MEVTPEISPHLRLARYVGRFARTLQRRIDPLLAEELGIKGRELFVLRTVEGGESNPMRIADRLVIAPSSASRILDHLVERGLIDRAGDPEDRRRTCLTLTDHGRDTARRARQLADDALHAAFRDVPLAEIEHAADVLARLSAQADPNAPTADVGAAAATASGEESRG